MGQGAGFLGAIGTDGDFDPALYQCWASVGDAGPALIQNWADSHQQTKNGKWESAEKIVRAV